VRIDIRSAQPERVGDRIVGDRMPGDQLAEQKNGT
jgi:hypothetical protein